MRLRRSLLPATFATLALTGACGDAELRGLPEFCREVLPRVQTYLEGQEQPEGARYGGTVVVGTIGEIMDGMNALITSDHSASQHQLFVNLMTLVTLDEALEPVPWLARSWEVAEDGSAVTFHLRDDVRWHDGTPTTAHDVAFTYRRVTDPEMAYPNAGFWSRYDTGPDGVEVIDSFTVRIAMEPHRDFIDPWRSVAIMPAHLLEDVPVAELRTHPYGTRCPVGNGPFVFREHRQNESWTFVRDPGFPEELGGPAYLERYVYRIIPEPTTLLAELLTENIDVYVAPLPDQAPRILEAEHLDLLEFEFRNYVFVAWNTRRPQLADARVRRALTMGTNRREVVEALRGGYARIANGGIPPTHWAYHDGLDDALPYDPEAARRLLDEAGWLDRDGDGVRENADGLPLAVTVKYNQGSQERRDIAEIMQAQLREIGVSVTPEVMEWATLATLIQDPARDFDGVVLSFVVEYNVDERDLFHSSNVDRPLHFTGIQDERLDRLLDTLPVLDDRDAALPLWREYQERIVELQPYTYFFYPLRLAGVNRRVRGIEMDLRGEWLNLREWWIPEDWRRGRSR